MSTRQTHRSLLLSAGIGLLLLGFNNCSSQLQPMSHKPTPTGIQDRPDSHLQGTSTGNPTPGKVTFEVVSKAVFQPHCVSCHSVDAPKASSNGDEILFDTYENTLAHGSIKTLYLHYRDHIEPSKKCDTVSSEKMDLVVQWIEDGAPL
ncbi:MAG: hypothetical protein AB7F86_09940 [Bdellovibrionales bacterium]